MAQTKAREAEQKDKIFVRRWNKAFCEGAISSASASRIKLLADVADITIVAAPSPGYAQCKSHCLKAGPFKAIRWMRVVTAHTTTVRAHSWTKSCFHRGCRCARIPREMPSKTKAMPASAAGSSDPYSCPSRLSLLWRIASNPQKTLAALTPFTNKGMLLPFHVLDSFCM